MLVVHSFPLRVRKQSAPLPVTIEKPAISYPVAVVDTVVVVSLLKRLAAPHGRSLDHDRVRNQREHERPHTTDQNYRRQSRNCVFNYAFPVY